MQFMRMLLEQSHDGEEINFLYKRMAIHLDEKSQALRV